MDEIYKNYQKVSEVISNVLHSLLGVASGFPLNIHDFSWCCTFTFYKLSVLFISDKKQTQI